ncbi:MAG: hypothetical protein PHW64_09285 [Sulfuricurvum sp.]|nr:hypothetical protein [Sulfuricurvum sp.]
MTNKDKSIHNLHQARTSHIRWVNTIKLLVSGIHVTEGSIELNPTDSLFGEWFYNEAMLFSLSNSQMVLEEIEALLLSLHDKYMKIYPIYYGEKKKTLISGLLGGKNKASEHEIALSQRYYEEIIVLSDKMKQKLRILESQMLSMSEEKFDAVAGFTTPVVNETLTLKIEEPVRTEESSYFYGTRGR